MKSGTDILPTIDLEIPALVASMEEWQTGATGTSLDRVGILQIGSLTALF